MPLPDTALVINGGCNCGAIRYRVAVPALAERPLHPLAPAKSPVSMPFLALDHCNDCRKATASILPAWICAPMDMCFVSLVAASTATRASKAAAREGQAEELREPWSSATGIFATKELPLSTNHFLKYYESSNERWRWFCFRCGTNVAYTAAMPEGFPSMLDITLGSVDRGDLDSDALVPERHLWWDYGIDWIRRLVTKGYDDLPIHPDYRIVNIIDPKS